MAVHVTLDDAKLQAFISATGAETMRYVADGVNYAIFQELGTVRQGYAQPFMRPATEAVRAGWEAAFKNNLTDEQVKAVVVKAAFDIEGIAKQLAPKDTSALTNSIHVTEDKP